MMVCVRLLVPVIKVYFFLWPSVIPLMLIEDVTITHLCTMLGKWSASQSGRFILEKELPVPTGMKSVNHRNCLGVWGVLL
jgi:hypothetical protein